MYPNVSKSSVFLHSTLLSPLLVPAGTAAEDVSLKNDKCINQYWSRNFHIKQTCPLCKHLQEYKEGFAVLHKLYVKGLVIGVSPASCEFHFHKVTSPYPLSSPPCFTWQKEEFGDLGPGEINNKYLRHEFVRIFAKASRKTDFEGR